MALPIQFLTCSSTDPSHRLRKCANLLLRHIREKYEREHPDHPTKESIQKRSKEWLEEKKREFYAMRELSAEDAAAEAKRKKALEEAKKTITITAANKSQE